MKRRSPFRYCTPALFTLAGLAFGLGGIVLGVAVAWPLLLASVACDVADGFIARQLDAVSRFGANLDWSVDVFLAHTMIWTLAKPLTAAVISAPLLLLQVTVYTEGKRVSGRVAVWAVAAWVTFVVPWLSTRG
jgi:phosphatidylglycerophosphate synthase